MRKQMWIISVIVLGAAMVLFIGCKENEEAMAPEHDHEGHAEHAMEAAADAKDTAIEQKVCPIMGQPIDKDLFVEHEGKKVYFCCPGCVDTFKADPEKYLSKLPQFEK